MTNDKYDIYDPNELKSLFWTAIDTADKLHKRYTEGANLTGYIRDRLVADECYWTTIAKHSKDDPGMAMTIASGIDFMRLFNQQLGELSDQLPDQTAKLVWAANSGATLDANTASLSDVAVVFEGKELEYQPCPFIKQGDTARRAERLEKLDRNLANTYRQVWETLHGTRSDPERSALFLMRQTYDHFFDLLAPDDEVRKSRVWTKKKGDKPDKIIRKERIEYAALTHIKNEAQAKMMSASAKPTLKVYYELNRAHKRGELNPEKERKAVQAMDKVISDWLDVLDF